MSEFIEGIIMGLITAVVIIGYSEWTMHRIKRVAK